MNAVPNLRIGDGLRPPVAVPPATTLSGWGRVPVVPGFEERSEDLVALTSDVKLARGLGRAYGDAALPAKWDLRVLGTSLADRILAFDEASGVLTAEAGLSLEDISSVFLPRGYFTPVAPGTQFVTLGGMIASDIHGKNHHCDGTFGRHVLSLKVRVGDGRIVRCSPTEHADLFNATIGGMGLTGPILEATVQLARVPSQWIFEEREAVRNLDEFIKQLKAAATNWPMTVGWIDCLSTGRHMGRGVIIRGRWAERDEAPPTPPSHARRVSVPFQCPKFVLSRASVRLFNAFYYRRHTAGVRRAVVAPSEFFFPLDSIRRWDRLYGHSGFTQYQCVIPDTAGPAAAQRFLTELTKRGGASFLCVIKDCGPEGSGMLSFPRPGISIALDIPMRPHTQSVVDALNERVIAEGGRIYLAKDALTRREHFAAMEPRIHGFLAVRQRWDPNRIIRSAQSTRLFGW